MSRLPRLAARLLFCAALLPGAVVAGQDVDDAPPAPGFTLVTLDLDGGPLRRTRIVEEMRRLQPDAIALQDVLQDESLPNQAEWLARELGYDVHFVTVDPPSHKRRQGNALLTRGEVLEEGETLLHPLEDRRTAGFVRLSVDDRPLNIYFTRFHDAPDGAGIRAHQLADLLAYVDATSGEAPSLIAGNLHAAADAPELAPLHADWQDAWSTLHPETGAAAGPDTLDSNHFDTPAGIGHVFAGRGRVEPVAAELLPFTPDADAVQLPDHRGLLVRLRIGDAAP